MDEMEEKEDMIECGVGEIRVREGSGWSSCLCVPDSGRQTLLVTDGTRPGERMKWREIHLLSELDALNFPGFQDVIE